MPLWWLNKCLGISKASGNATICASLFLASHLIFAVSSQALIWGKGVSHYMYQYISNFLCLNLNIDLGENTFQNICDYIIWHLCYSNVLFERIIYFTLHILHLYLPSGNCDIFFKSTQKLSAWFRNHARYPQGEPRSRQPLSILSFYQRKCIRNDKLPVLDQCNKTPILVHLILEWFFPTG